MSAPLNKCPAGWSVEDLLWSLLNWCPSSGSGSGGGGGGSRIAAPFVHSDDLVAGDYSGELLDDPRGSTGDFLWDPSHPEAFYVKIDATPHQWIRLAASEVDTP